MISDEDIVRWSQIRSWFKRFLIWYLIYLFFFSLYDFEYPLESKLNDSISSKTFINYSILSPSTLSENMKGSSYVFPS